MFHFFCVTDLNAALGAAAVFAAGVPFMYAGQLVFAQLMEHLPWQTFRRIVERYGGDRRVRD